MGAGLQDLSETPQEQAQLGALGHVRPPRHQLTHGCDREALTQLLRDKELTSRDREPGGPLPLAARPQTLSKVAGPSLVPSTPKEIQPRPARSAQSSLPEATKPGDSLS